MNKISKFVLFVCTCLVQQTLLFAENKETDAMKVTALSRIIQSLRIPNSISFEYTKEGVDSGGRWEVYATGRVQWDRKNSAFNLREMEQNSPNVLLVHEKIVSKGRCYSTWYRRHGTLAEGDTGKIFGRGTGTVSIDAVRNNEVPFDGIEKAFSLNGVPIRNLITTELVDIKKIVLDDKGSKITIDGGEFLFDLATGRLISKTEDFSHAKYNPRSIWEWRVSDYYTKDGWSIPTCVNYTLTDFMPDKERKTPPPYISRGRYTIKKETIQVNKIETIPLKFSVEIPKGHLVNDSIRGITYRSLGTDGSLPVEDIAKELENVLKKAEETK